MVPKEAITTSVAVSLLRLDATLVTVGIVNAKPFAVSLSTILAVRNNVTLIVHDMDTHVAVHKSALLLFNS